VKIQAVAKVHTIYSYCKEKIALNT